MSKRPNFPEGVIIEKIAQGKYLKVTAVDPIRYYEATIVGDPKVPQKELENLAIRKLEYVIQKMEKK